MNTRLDAADYPKMRLVVEVTARLTWMNPPANKEEEVMREHANNMAMLAAHDTREVAALVISQLLLERARS